MTFITQGKINNKFIIKRLFYFLCQCPSKMSLNETAHKTICGFLFIDNYNFYKFKFNSFNI